MALITEVHFPSSKIFFSHCPVFSFPIIIVCSIIITHNYKRKKMETEKKSNPSLLITIIYWLTTGIIALETIAGAEWNLTRNQYVKDIFAHLGYPLYVLTIIGIWKIPAFITILIPKFPLVKEWAYAGLFFVYTGAAASHFAAGDDATKWAGPAIFSAIVVASWALRPPSRRIA